MDGTTVTLSLARRADRFPDRTAIVDVSEHRLYAPAETVHDDRVSYGELAAIVDRTAERLAALDVGVGDTVCYVSRNRVASIALLFACRRLGATYAPISHRLTPATVKRPFEVLDPDLVVSEAAQRDLVRSIPFDRSVTLEKLAETDRTSTEDGDRVAVSVDEDADRDGPLLALHGETGRPIVGYSASAVEWNCITAAVTWGLSGDDSGLVSTPLSAADGLFRIALPLLYVGGTLVLDRAFDPGDALTAIDARDVTVLAGRATVVRELAADEGFAAIEAVDLVICDEATDQDLVAPYAARDVPMVRAYGRLECPTALCQTTGTDPVAGTGVGRPLPDCRARLVDDEGTTLDGAVEGRLQLSGPVLATDYVAASGTDDEEWYEPAIEEAAESAASDDGLDGTDEPAGEGEPDHSGDADGDRGRFEDNWFDTGDRFRRDEDGSYHSM
ncbi:class I adenylate-forming enzyme family protein [Halosolutus gelatinilyticus]|uniref:class I adenylate-forming enzyme family protein n=1 Tax=Halosolutus gelatinilyticus TaxID=2931975 RepID=UPI001FF1ABAC|nr:AMP-binding protein [Halosolutus gelatinilyticus]